MLALLSGRLSGWRLVSDAVGRRNRRRGAVRRVLGGGAAPAYAATGVKNSAAIVSLAYPVSEVVTVTVAVLVLARAHARWRVTVTLLTVGLTLIAASGSAYEYLFARNNYAFDNPVDLAGPGW